MNFSPKFNLNYIQHIAFDIYKEVIFEQRFILRDSSTHLDFKFMRGAIVNRSYFDLGIMRNIPAKEESCQIRCRYRIAIFVRGCQIFFVDSRQTGKSRIVSARGVEPARFQNGCLAGAVLAGDQGHAAETGNFQRFDSPKTGDRQARQVKFIGRYSTVCRHGAGPPDGDWAEWHHRRERRGSQAAAEKRWRAGPPPHPCRVSCRAAGFRAGPVRCRGRRI